MIVGVLIWFIVCFFELVFVCGGIFLEFWFNFWYCCFSWCGCFFLIWFWVFVGVFVLCRVIIWVYWWIGSGYYLIGIWELCWWILNVELLVLNGIVLSWMFRCGFEVCSLCWRLEWGGMWMEWIWSFLIRFCNFGVGLRRIINIIDVVKKFMYFSFFLCLWNELLLCR